LPVFARGNWYSVWKVCACAGRLAASANKSANDIPHPQNRFAIFFVKFANAEKRFDVPIGIGITVTFLGGGVELCLGRHNREPRLSVGSQPLSRMQILFTLACNMPMRSAAEPCKFLHVVGIGRAHRRFDPKQHGGLIRNHGLTSNRNFQVLR